MEKKGKRSSLSAWMVKETAEKHNVTEQYVRMVIRAERESEEVLNTYMALSEGANKLVNAVRVAVAF